MTPPPPVRPARPADMETLVALTRATYAEHAQRQPDWFPATDPVPTEAIIHALLGGLDLELGSLKTVHLVYEDKGRILGHVLVLHGHSPKREPGREDHIAEIVDISILPEARGQGIGHCLVQSALDGLRDIGCTVAVANVWAGNLASEALFRSKGFDPAQTEFRLRLAPPHDSVPPVPPTALQQPWPHLRPLLPILLLLSFGGLLAFLGR